MDASAGGVEAGLEQAVALGRGTGHRRLLLHQQVRQGERRPDRRARRAAGELRQQDRAAPARDRRRRDVRGLRRPRPPQGVAARTARRGRDPDPGRAGRRGGAPPRPAARGGRRGGRRRPDQVPRGRGDLRPRARGVPAQGRQGIDPRARAGRQRDDGDRPARRCSTRSSATSPPPPTRRREGGRQVRRDGRGRRRRERPAPRRACSRRPPTRSSGG